MSSALKPIDFFTGWPSPSLLPPLSLEAAAKAVLTNPAIASESLKYGPDEGYHPLRDEISKWLTKFYKPEQEISPDRLCITGGASQNLACILQSFTDPVYTRNIWMVAPTYFLACRIFDDSGFSGRMRGVPEDEEGIDIDYLAKHIAASEHAAVSEGNNEPRMKTKYPWRTTYKHIIYAVPTFANPSGRVMSLSRRQQLVRLAREYDALIVTDDVYDMLQWSPTADGQNSIEYKARVPRIVDVDRFLDGGPTSEWGNAVSNGSFSKILAPGCRTGWAEATPKLAWALSQCGSSRSGGAPSHLVASMINEMMVRGQLEDHVRSVLLPAYEKRYQKLTQSVRTHLEPLGVTYTLPNTDVAGGYFVWLTLPSPLLADDIRERALNEQNVTTIAGPKFRVQGDEKNENTKFNRSIRLCFSWMDEGDLDEGILRLRKVVEGSLKS